MKQLSLWKYRVPARYRLQLFFTLHPRLITYVGGIFVFFTFVVKEGYREHERDIRDSIDAAELRYLIRTNYIDEYIKLSAINTDTAETLAWTRIKGQEQKNIQLGVDPKLASSWIPNDGHTSARPTGADRQASLISSIEAADAFRMHPYLEYNNFGSMNLSLKATTELMNSLPSVSQGLRDAAAREETRVKVTMARLPTYKQTESAIRQREKMRAETGRPTEDDIERLAIIDHQNEMNSFQSEITQTWIEAKQLDIAVFSAAREIEERTARFYRVLTWLSYGLDLLGLGLAFVGHVLGKEAMPGLD